MAPPPRSLCVIVGVVDVFKEMLMVKRDRGEEVLFRSERDSLKYIALWN